MMKGAEILVKALENEGVQHIFGIPGAGDFYMGTAALSERDYVHEAIEAADLIITIGHSTVRKTTFFYGENTTESHSKERS